MTKEDRFKMGAILLLIGAGLLGMLVYLPAVAHALSHILDVPFFYESMWILGGIALVGGVYEVILGIMGRASTPSIATIITPPPVPAHNDSATPDQPEEKQSFHVENVVLGVSMVMLLVQIAMTVFGVVTVVSITSVFLWAMEENSGGNGQLFLTAMYIIDGIVIAIGLGVAVFSMVTVGKEMK